MDVPKPMNWNTLKPKRTIVRAPGKLPAGTVKSIIHRAKDKLRTQFEIESYQHG